MLRVDVNQLTANLFHGLQRDGRVIDESTTFFLRA